MLGKARDQAFGGRLLTAVQRYWLPLLILGLVLGAFALISRTMAYVALALLQMTAVVLVLYLLMVVVDFESMSPVDQPYYVTQCNHFLALDWLLNSSCVLADWLLVLSSSGSGAGLGFGFPGWKETLFLLTLSGYVVWDSVEHVRSGSPAGTRARPRLVDVTSVWKTHKTYRIIMFVKVVYSALAFGGILSQMGFHLSANTKIRDAMEQTGFEMEDFLGNIEGFR
jgi:hypothetical protein